MGAATDGEIAHGREISTSATGRSLLCLGLGGALLVCVSLGPMAAELGSFSIVVWFVTAAVGLAQCVLIARVARDHRRRAGGTPSYVHAVLGRERPLLGALAVWAYWFAWTPGVVINLTLVGQYLHSTVLPDVAPGVIAIVAGCLLYSVNAYGVRLAEHLAAAVTVVAAVPLVVLLGGVLLKPGALDVGRLTPWVPEGVQLGAASGVLLVFKWAFVAAWSSYGGELASTAAAEVRSTRVACRCIRASGFICLAAFTVVPVILTLLVGPEGLSRDAQVVFLEPAEALFGDAGRIVVGLMLAAGLLLGAHAFIVGSSRNIYQLTLDGYLPRQFAYVNPRGAPMGSLALDALVVLLVVAVLGDHILMIVAAANVGYLIVFILLPYAVLVSSRRGARIYGLALPRILLVINALLLVIGAPQWGLAPVALACFVLSFTLILTRAAKRRWAAEEEAAVAEVAARTRPGGGFPADKEER